MRRAAGGAAPTRSSGARRHGRRSDLNALRSCPESPVTVALLFCATSAFAQQGDGTRASFANNIFKPAKVAPTAERIAQLKLPPGFTVNVFASGLKNARVLAVAPDGTVYLSRRDQGDVLMLKDVDGDGRRRRTRR